MRIKTKYFGEVEITEEMVVDFPNGLLGFAESKKFAVLDVPQTAGFRFLQDTENDYVSFMMVSPWEFFPDYEAIIEDSELQSIKTESSSESDLEVYLVVTIGSSFNETTANLIAPIVINTVERLGKQFVLHDSKYKTKHKMIPEGAGE